MESSDRLPDNLEKYCGALKRRAAMRAAVVNGLSYPAFLLLLVFGLLAYVGRVVVPALDDLLPSESWMGGARILADASGFAARNGIAVALSLGAAAILIAAALPRWSKSGRRHADALPVFAVYRLYTGVSFLIAMGALMASGLTAAAAIEKLRPFSNRYVRHRLDLIRFYLLNGSDLGSAMHFADTGWPDGKLNLSLKILSQTRDFSSQLIAGADGWLATAQESIERRLGAIRSLAFIAVFGAVAFVISALYQLQHQIAASF